MEDAHAVVTNMPSHPDSAFFGVFDGHSGYKASEYCAAHFHTFVDKYPTIDAKTLSEATMAVDKSFMEEFPTADDGCTATYCVVHSDDCTCSNASTLTAICLLTRRYSRS
jgi:serine/threonine protein phosphatase PrpC